jgi:hypothetical protein
VIDFSPVASRWVCELAWLPRRLAVGRGAGGFGVFAGASTTACFLRPHRRLCRRLGRKTAAGPCHKGLISKEARGSCRYHPVVAVSCREEQAAPLLCRPGRARHGFGARRHSGRHCARVGQVRYDGHGWQFRRHALPSSLSRLRKTLPRHGQLPFEVLPDTCQYSGRGTCSAFFDEAAHSTAVVQEDGGSSDTSLVATS